MSLRFRRSIRLARGFRINLGKRGASLSLGVRGAHVTYGRTGTRETVGLPGSGISYTHLDRRPAEAASGHRTSLARVVLLVILVAVAILLFATVR